jgi:hypothetical protein
MHRPLKYTKISVCCHLLCLRCCCVSPPHNQSSSSPPSLARSSCQLHLCGAPPGAACWVPGLAATYWSAAARAAVLLLLQEHCRDEYGEAQ